MRTRPSSTLVLLAAATISVGCVDHGHTDELITTGTDASNQLHSYYDHLTTIALDGWQYQAAFNTLQGAPASPKLEQTFADRITALRARAQLAGRLAETYTAITKLKGTKTTEPALQATDNLGKAMAGLPGLPGINIGDGLTKAAAFLTGRQQARDVRKANQDLTIALHGIKDVFLTEHDAYEQIARDRDHNRHDLIAALAKRKLLNTTPLLEQLHLGLPVASTDETQFLALSVDEHSIRRSTIAWSCTTQETTTMLDLLIAGHEQLSQGHEPNPASLKRTIARANAYMAEYGGKQ